MLSSDPLDWGNDAGSAPKWVVTFADLMALILCFFVLLVSFSEFDTSRYHGAAGAMREAFGAPSKVQVPPNDAALSTVALAAPEAAIVDVKPDSPWEEPVLADREGLIEKTIAVEPKSIPEVPTELGSHLRYLAPVSDRTRQAVESLVTAIQDSISKGWVDVVVNDEAIMIRINEQGSFPSGSADLHATFLPVLMEMTRALNQIEGRILVEGHTDDVPIQNLQYPSNWVLSAARAANVVHHLTQSGLSQPQRLEIRAHADTAPLAPNTDPEQRGKNRRVEINIALNEPAKPGASQSVPTEEQRP
ncbi:MAG: flagellar motor protein MotB [Thiotrichales bacterium]